MRSLAALQLTGANRFTWKSQESETAINGRIPW